MKSGNSTPFKEMGSSPAKLDWGSIAGKVDKALRTNLDGSTSEGSLLGKHAHDYVDPNESKKNESQPSLNVNTDNEQKESKDTQEGLKSVKMGVTNK